MRNPNKKCRRRRLSDFAVRLNYLFALFVCLFAIFASESRQLRHQQAKNPSGTPSHSPLQSNGTNFKLTFDDLFLIRPKKAEKWNNNTTIDSNIELNIEPPFALTRSKREVYRGQNYHYQRGYELSRLRFENRHPNRPKSFFVREYHEGRDVPHQLLRLTQIEKLKNEPALIETGIAGSPGKKAPSDDDSPSSLIEADISAGSRRPPSPSAPSESMKTMSDDYRQRLYATKAALKAALQRGDQDLSILQFIKAKQAQDDAKARESGQTREGDDNSNKQNQQPDSINKGVRFDEQIKEDLDKIVSYDPSKAFGERLRPFPIDPTAAGRRPTSPTSFPDFSTGIGGGSGAGGGGGGDYLKKLRLLYPHLFPTSSGGVGGGGGGSSGDSDGKGGGGGGGGRDGIGRPSARPGDADADGGTSGNRTGGDGGGPSRTNFDIGGPGGSRWTGTRVPPKQFPGVQPIGGSGGGGGTGNGSHIPPIVIPAGGSGFRSPYPSRFPGTRLSGLTLWPNVRNSTFPGIPGYIRYDYPGYSVVPYTGFRCDLMPYKYGYYADVSAGCQVFHICQKDGRMDSFLCPNGTLFQQKVMTCEWWYHVNCPSSSRFFHLNARIGVLPFLPATLARFD